MKRMQAIVRGFTGKHISEMSEDDFFEAYGHAKYYLSLVSQVKFE